MTTMLSESLTPTEAAIALRVSAPTVYKLLAAGELPARKVHGHWQIHPDDVRAFTDRKSEH